jgi:hypothetical protein
VAGGDPVAALPALLGTALPLTAFVLEAMYLSRARARLGFTDEVPRVTASDLFASALVWLSALARAVLFPSRWHRARGQVESPVP